MAYSFNFVSASHKLARGTGAGEFMFGVFLTYAYTVFKDFMAWISTQFLLGKIGFLIQK